MRARVSINLTILVLLFAVAAPAAHAGLQRVGPVSAVNGYPLWYQDTTGVALEFCTPLNASELAGGWCVLLPGDTTAPELFPGSFFDEHFYWLAGAGVRTTGQVVLALEGAFAVGPVVQGDQVVFGRVRVVHTSLPQDGDYHVETPFGNFDFPGMLAGEKLFFTSDIGIGCSSLNGFTCALNSEIGPFLLPSATPGGPEMPPVTAANPTPDTDPLHFGGGAPTAYPGTGKAYIADPARVGPVTGSPVGQNYFRITATLGGVTTLITEEFFFSLNGRVMTGGMPGLVTVNRASYTDKPALNEKKLDVFATGAPTGQGRLPAGVVPAPANPALGYYLAPCATDPVTGDVIGAPSGVPVLPMAVSGMNWWGQTQFLPADEIPLQVCVRDSNARDAFGNLVPAYFMKDVADEVDITVRNWDPTLGGGTLTVAATSSDLRTLPTLTVAGFGPIDPATGQFQVSNLPAPPATVTVVSNRTGLATLDVRTGTGSPSVPAFPVANPDSATTAEDTAASSINVLANDSVNGSPIDPLVATVLIVRPPLSGTATLNPDKTITYSPSLNFFGTDAVGYTVTVGGQISNEGTLTVTVVPANDPPVANPDTAATSVNLQIPINVLANDTDPDGQADLAAALIVTLPAAGATVSCNGGVPAAVGTVCAGGNLTFTATASATFTFTYRALDQAGTPSTLATTVTATVTPGSDVITLTAGGTEFRTSKRRMVINATSSVNSPTVILTLQPYACQNVAGQTPCPASGTYNPDPAAGGLGNTFTNNGGGTHVITLINAPPPACNPPNGFSTPCSAAPLRATSNLGGTSAPHAIDRIRN